MKRFKWLKITFVFLAVMSISVFHVTAGVDKTLQDKNAKAISRLGIINGDNKGNLYLENQITRIAFIAMFTRMMGYEYDKDLSSIEINFKDIPKNYWGTVNIKASLKYKIDEGFSDNTFKPDQPVTYADALKILLKTLGYRDAANEKSHEAILKKASELGLTKNLDLAAEKGMDRGEASILIYNAMTAEFKK